MSSMLPIRSFTFIEAGASLVGQRAALPVGAGAWPRGRRPVRVRRARAGPDAVAPGSSCRAEGPEREPGVSCTLVCVAGGAVSRGMSGPEALQRPRAPVWISVASRCVQGAWRC